MTIESSNVIKPQDYRELDTTSSWKELTQDGTSHCTKSSISVTVYTLEIGYTRVTIIGDLRT